MASRAQSLTITYVAWNTSSNSGATGDVSNHTLRWVKDGASAAPTNSATEVDGTNAPGLYKLTLTSSECTCDVGVLGGKSSTANVVVIPVTITFELLPTALVSGRVDASVGAMAANVLTAAAINTGAITNAKFATDAIDSAVLAASAVTEVAGAVWDEARSGHTTSGTFGQGVLLAAAALDAVLVESGISASGALTNDSGTQLTSINGRQALALILSAAASVLAGAATTNVTIKQAGKPAGATRIDATVDATGNRSALNLKVPD